MVVHTLIPRTTVSLYPRQQSHFSFQRRLARNPQVHLKVLVVVDLLETPPQISTLVSPHCTESCGCYRRQAVDIVGSQRPYVQSSNCRVSRAVTPKRENMFALVECGLIIPISRPGRPSVSSIATQLGSVSATCFSFERQQVIETLNATGTPQQTRFGAVDRIECIQLLHYGMIV